MQKMQKNRRIYAKKDLSSSSTQQSKTGLNSVRAAVAGAALRTALTADSIKRQTITNVISDNLLCST